MPIDARLQALFALAVMAGVGWLSYSTGVYFGYQKTLGNKQEAILEISQKNDELTAQNSLMYRDMMRLIKEGKAQGSGEYQNFLMDHYATSDQPEAENSAVLERIGYLETRLNELENYQQTFLQTLQERTGQDIEDLKKIIDMTGLSLGEIKPIKTREKEASLPQPRIASDSDVVDYKHQGGPYEEARPVSINTSEDQVVMQVAKLIQLHDLYENLPLSFPVKEGRMTSGFGVRRDPITRRRAMHSGLDFAAPHNSPVYVTAPGKVITAERDGAYGNMVVVSHGNNVTTRYAHLSRIEVKSGDELVRGDVVGRQGSTGRSTGDHLHYEVRWNDRPMDPRNFIKAGIYARQKRSEAKQQ